MILTQKALKSAEKIAKQQRTKLKKNFSGLPIKTKYWLSDIDRIGYLDIECTNLKGNMGYILSWAMVIRDTQEGGKQGKVLGIKYGVITKKDIEDSDDKHFEDARILKELIYCIQKYKIKLLIGHWFHGAHRMDIPFIRTRCIMNKIDGYPKYKQVKYGDTQRMAKNGYSLHRNSLDAVGDMCGVSTKKTPVSGRHWQLAARGNTKSVQYVLHHNINDVKINHKIHLKMEDWCGIPSAYV